MNPPRWSQRARADLKAIHDYIAKDSPLTAKRVVRDIVTRVSALAQTPRIGRRVPELDEPEIREVTVHSWRIVYRLQFDGVRAVRPTHSANAAMNFDRNSRVSGTVTPPSAPKSFAPLPT